MLAAIRNPHLPNLLMMRGSETFVTLQIVAASSVPDILCLCTDADGNLTLFQIESERFAVAVPGSRPIPQASPAFGYTIGRLKFVRDHRRPPGSLKAKGK